MISVSGFLESGIRRGCRAGITDPMSPPLKAATPFSTILHGWILTRSSVMVAIVDPRQQHRPILRSQRNMASKMIRLNRGLFTKTV